jgi:hypothetical protein
MTRAYPYFVYAIIGIFVWCGWAYAATDWLPSTERYYKYDTTPTNLTDSSYKYIVTTNIEVNSVWKKLSGTWIKYTTVNGGLKYGEEVVIAQPPAPTCQAFVCKDDFGITFDLSKNTVLDCPRVQISKEQIASIYDATKVNNIPPCR